MAPTDPLPIVHYDAKAGARGLEVMRWGLIPYWAREIKIGFSTFNARGEEVDTKPAFREAFRQRRCLVPLDSFCECVTTAPNELCAEFHNRVPVVLKPAAWPVWLGEQPADVPQLKALLVPYPSDEMICWPVSARVGKVRNNDPSLIEPIAAAG